MSREINAKEKVHKPRNSSDKTGETMRKTPLLAVAILAAAVSGAPEFAAAMGSDNPSPPQSSKPSGSTTTKQKTKKEKSSSAKDFLDRYHAAYALIYDKGDFEGGIAALRAMGYDDNADVATLLGYANRKLGRYDDAKYWYEKALAVDPNLLAPTTKTSAISG
jgi:tetratricopeptide (TPR) repeat protein